MTLRRPVKIALICSGVPLALVLAGWLLVCLMSGSSPFHPNPFDTLKFNQHDWMEDRACVDGSNRRGHMAANIMDHYLCPDMTETQLTSLLGAPDHVYTRAEIQHHLNASQQGIEPETYFQQCDFQAAKVDDYYLGEELNMGWGIDRAWLYLYLNPQGQYIGCRIHTP